MTYGDGGYYSGQWQQVGSSPPPDASARLYGDAQPQIDLLKRGVQTANGCVRADGLHQTVSYDRNGQMIIDNGPGGTVYVQPEPCGQPGEQQAQYGPRRYFATAQQDDQPPPSYYQPSYYNPSAYNPTAYNPSAFNPSAFNPPAPYAYPYTSFNPVGNFFYRIGAAFSGIGGLLSGIVPPISIGYAGYGGFRRPHLALGLGLGLNFGGYPSWSAYPPPPPMYPPPQFSQGWGSNGYS